MQLGCYDAELAAERAKSADLQKQLDVDNSSGKGS
jgi:hypothetical protein